MVPISVLGTPRCIDLLGSDFGKWLPPGRGGEAVGTGGGGTRGILRNTYFNYEHDHLKKIFLRD